MTINLRKKMAKLKESCSELQKLVAHPPRWEEKFVIPPNEHPWWVIINPEEKKRAYCRQYLRMWQKLHPGYQVGVNRKYVRISRKEPGMSQLFQTPYKREPVAACELCSRLPEEKEYLGYHHWNDNNASAGLWVCLECNCFAEAVDAGEWILVKRYTTHRKLLDELYADGNIVERAKLARQRRRIKTTINGVHKLYMAWGKRDKPNGDLCELCDITKCSNYHHWDDSILGKGIHVCRKCHAFAERFDLYGDTFVEKYLSLKKQEELRVLALMKTNSEEFTLDMFPSLNIGDLNKLR